MKGALSFLFYLIDQFKGLLVAVPKGGSHHQLRDNLVILQDIVPNFLPRVNQRNFLQTFDSFLN